MKISVINFSLLAGMCAPLSVLATESFCEGEKNIPFMATNVILTEDGDQHYWGYHSDNSVDEVQFLKNIKYCPDAGFFGAYRVYGELISLEDFKAEVGTYLQTNADKFDHVFYNVHGFNVDPEGAFYGAYNFHQNHADSKYLVIPINWRTVWGASIFSYDYDRDNNAPPFGKQLTAAADVFIADYKTSVMAHSMGNYAFRVMAQNINKDSPEILFENIFMVAADARMDMFSDEFNPEAPGVDAGTGTSFGLRIPDDELVPNGGYDIARIGKHVHVAWNHGDVALHLREGFQMGFGDNVRKALGKFGGQSEELMRLPYFQKRVTFHDFTDEVRDIEGYSDIGHNYQWYEPLVELYKNEKTSSESSTMNISTE